MMVVVGFVVAVVDRRLKEDMRRGVIRVGRDL